MRRWTFHILAAISLALLIGCAVLWVRSVRVSDQIAYRQDPLVMTLMTAPHGLCLQRGEVPSHQRGIIVGSAQNLVFPVEGWSVRTLPWGPVTITSGTGKEGLTSFSMRLTIKTNNPWVPPVNSLLGFGWETQPRPLLVVVPFWFLVIALAILPVLWARRAWRDRTRQRGGLCPKCGYDLRATPGRCPECGHQVGEDFHPAALPVESADQ